MKQLDLGDTFWLRSERRWSGPDKRGTERICSRVRVTFANSHRFEYEVEEILHVDDPRPDLPIIALGAPRGKMQGGMTHDYAATLLGTQVFLSEPALCVHCTGWTLATHFTGEKDPFDPACDAHFAEFFDECPNCNAVRQKDDVRQTLVAHASMAGPEEYDEGCSNCMPDDREPDPDRDEFD